MQPRKWTIPHPSKAMEVCQEKILTQNRWSIICLQLQRKNLLVKWRSVMHQYSNPGQQSSYYMNNTLSEGFFSQLTVILKHDSNWNSKGKLIRHNSDVWRMSSGDKCIITICFLIKGSYLTATLQQPIYSKCLVSTLTAQPWPPTQSCFFFFFV